MWIADLSLCPVKTYRTLFRHPRLVAESTAGILTHSAWSAVSSRWIDAQLGDRQETALARLAHRHPLPAAHAAAIDDKRSDRVGRARPAATPVRRHQRGVTGRGTHVDLESSEPTLVDRAVVAVDDRNAPNRRARRHADGDPCIHFKVARRERSQVSVDGIACRKRTAESGTESSAAEAQWR